ncbi:transmembrane protein 43 homolog [Euwallacea fornicatus]|uniref:transmembrane protein 43 homolog n=1 Tax=Euwallacea fornicatus TaxID=995702 RepID=UPI00338F9B59
MDITFQEEFQKSWLTSLIGILALCSGLYLLTWNEGRAVHHHHSLEETYNSAISLNLFNKLEPEYDGHVVHISSDLKVDEPLGELEYGISIQAVKLKRRVQMYQWVEETSPRDDVVEQQSYKDYYYITEWRDKLVDSDNFYIRFGHENPKEIPLKTVTYVAPLVRLGPFYLSDSLKDKFTEFETLTSDERPGRSDIKLHMGIYYHCHDVFNPEVGDIRVQFSYAGPTDEPVTIVARQEKGTLVPYITSKGKEIALVRYGKLDLNQIFSAEHWDFKLETWKLRLYGAFCIYFAVICWARLLKIILCNCVPTFSNIISGEAIDGMNFLVAGSIALFVIALAWVAHRPLLGMSLIFASFSPFFYCLMGVYGGAPNDLMRN